MPPIGIGASPGPPAVMAAKTESTRRPAPPQVGHVAGSWPLDIGRSTSKRSSQGSQWYSYSGITPSLLADTVIVPGPHRTVNTTLRPAPL